MNKNIVITEKIRKLDRMSRDRTLSREERKEALKELKLEKYRIDPRPSISVRKQTVINNWLWLSSSVIFWYMLINDAFKLQTAWYTNVIMGTMVVFAAVNVVIAIYTMDKYKNELDDELSTANKIKTETWSWLIIFLAIFIGGGLWLMVNDKKTITIQGDIWSELFCCMAFTKNLRSGVLFIFFEGKEPKTDDE